MPEGLMSGNSPSDSDAMVTQEQFDVLKRKYDRLVGQSTKKRRHSKNPTVEERARGIRKIACLYTNISTLVAVALIQEEGDIDSDLEETVTEEERKKHKVDMHRQYGSYLALCRLIPDFRGKSTELRDDELLGYYHQLNTAANNARGDDVHRLKEIVVDWIGEGEQPLAPPLSKLDRGGRWLHHGVTARLLCPITYDWDDPDIRRKFRTGDHQHDINRSFFHRCLYHNETGDPNNVESGFLKGALLLKTFKHIFTAPSSAKVISDHQFEPAQKRPRLHPSERTVANLLGMGNQVTPRALAYAAVQLIFNLSEAPNWVQEYDGYKFSSLYNFIIDFFEAPDLGPKAKERARALLAWWNRKVFPPSSNPQDDLMDGDRLSRDLLAEQRALAEADSIRPTGT